MQHRDDPDSLKVLLIVPIHENIKQGRLNNHADEGGLYDRLKERRAEPVSLMSKHPKSLRVASP